MPLIRTVTVHGHDHGQVEQKSGCWCWHWDGAAMTFPKEQTLEDARAAIATEFGVSQRDVKLQERAR